LRTSIIGELTADQYYALKRAIDRANERQAIARFREANAEFRATCYHCGSPITTLGDAILTDEQHLVHVPGKCDVDPSRVLTVSDADTLAA
jgi:hypothetical protein